MDALLVALNAKYVHTSLSVRSLAAYCGSSFSVDTLEMTINDRFDRIRAELFHSRAPIVGFSCYIWNIELVLKLAQGLKKADPSVMIVLGGPEVSFDAAELLQQHAFLDCVISGEGEQPLFDLLAKKPFDLIAGLAYRKDEAVFVNPPGGPIALDDIPFAYDCARLPQAPQIIYYESSRGCPFSCGFCLSAGSKVRFLSDERALAELTAFAAANVHQVKLVDRTFNADPKRARRIFAALAALDTTTNFHFEIAAHLIDDETLRVLKDAPAGRFQFEIGVQTTAAQTLSVIGRPDRFERIAEVTRAIRSFGNIHLHLDLIAGLPNETMQQFARSFDDVFALRPHMLQLGFLKFLKGSRLRAQASQFGGIYADYPPYEVLATDTLPPYDLLALKLVEQAVDRFYHAGHTDSALVHLLRNESSSFSFFLRLGRFSESRECNFPSPLAAIETLWAFSQSENKAGKALNSLLVFDWLRPQKRGMLPPCLSAEPNESDAAQIRMFYKLRAAEALGESASDTQAWRRCAVHIFPLDVSALMENGEIHSRRYAVFFDYINSTYREISL